VSPGDSDYERLYQDALWLRRMSWCPMPYATQRDYERSNLAPPPGLADALIAYNIRPSLRRRLALARPDLSHAEWLRLAELPEREQGLLALALLDGWARQAEVILSDPAVE
jgi:hypothetical protein